ncbi:DUF6053 domain-containing protein [Pelagicoccus mobilis]|uniref:DUF6053 domain-containing protein n=1 Tax=Pelagicoccus mobilis TaxID=415221 RepID=UPI0035EBE3BF
MGGPSGPMPSSQIAAIRKKSFGPEGPPTKQLQPHRAGSMRRRCRYGAAPQPHRIRTRIG